MKQNTKQQLFSYITSKSSETTQYFNAQQLSEAFSMSRNLMSQYLNELVREGKLQKTDTRPISFYLDETQKKNIRQQGQMTENVEFAESQGSNCFQEIIGETGSMQSIIEQCKAAVKYPPNGLPILLTGPSGTGKSYLASFLHLYAMQENIISSKKQFVVVNCSEFANNPELLTSNLFGYKKGAFTGAVQDTVGLIQVADGGILFLDEVHNLSPSCQEKLFLYMDKGVYHLVGDNEHWKKSNARLIFATTKNPGQSLLATLLRRIPVVVQIPSMEERPLQEKERMIFQFVLKESEHLQKSVKMTYAYFHVLRTYHFRANVGELKSVIRQSCANAFLLMDNKINQVILKTFHLPSKILEYAAVFLPDNIKENDPRIIDPTEQQIKGQTREIIKLYKILLQDFSDNHSIMEKILEWEKKTQDALHRYYDYLVFEQRADPHQLEVYETAIENISAKICQQYKIQLKNNTLIPIIRYVFEQSYSQRMIVQWEEEHKKNISDFYGFLSKQYPKEIAIADEFSERTEKCFNLPISKMNRIILALNIRANNPYMKVSRVMGVILCHGYSTASSIADVANSLLHDFVFESIDMPIDVTVDQIGERLQQLVRRRHMEQDIVLLVDMGSLEEIYDSIGIISNINIGILTNVTIKMALDVGERILKNEEMSNILVKACKRNVSTYKILKNRQKEKAILFISETGIENAKNIAELFVRSLPREISVEIIPYDYIQLLKNGRTEGVFSQKDVLCIVGTADPNIDTCPYIAVEGLICGAAALILQKVLVPVLTEEELTILQKNMIHWFSLQNVVKYLTILDADKVLSLASNALEMLQSLLQVSLASQTLVGLNVHLSCLVERLVKKIPVTIHKELESFQREHALFIDACHKSFFDLETYYGIQIPLHEIAYLYEYCESYKHES